MNKRNILLLGLIATFVLGNQGFAQESDSVTMGSDYANDIYYSLKDGQTANPERMAWDIAFRTNIMSSSITINGGSGVMLYTYPNGDTGAWATVDTTGLSSWTEMNNSLKNWEEGAFMANAGKHPDYGWGQYNNTSHKLFGDSIFIIKLIDGTFRKIVITSKDSPKNTYYFRFANLDGSNEQNITLNCNDYKDKMFVAYSLSSNMVVDREPASQNWDLLFTKYVDKIYMGPSPVNYPVAGILTNDGVYVAKVTGEEETTFEDYSSVTFDSANISVIGRDWKKGVGMPPVYHIVDSQLYFISDMNQDIYKLYFTRFESGSFGNGVFTFTKKKLKSAGIFNETNAVIGKMSIYPNPASAQNIRIVFVVESEGSYQLDLVDPAGKSVFSNQVQAHQGLNTISLTDAKLVPGNYIAVIRNNEIQGSIHFIVY